MKYRVKYEIDKIDKNDNWTTLYKKSLGIYKKNDIKEVVNMISKKYSDSDEIEIYEKFATIYLHTELLPNDIRTENVIYIEEIV